MLTIRPGGPADVPAVLALLDDAARWLVEQGRTGQWGTAQQSTDPRRIDAVTRYAQSGDLYLACDGDAPAGALAVGAAPPYVPPAERAELYVNLLVTDRRRAGHGIGRQLLEHARHLAVAAGRQVLRLDCYAGGDGALIRYYQRAGFTPTDRFTVEARGGPWPGQILQRPTDLIG